MRSFSTLNEVEAGGGILYSSPMPVDGERGRGGSRSSESLGVICCSILVSATNTVVSYDVALALGALTAGLASGHCVGGQTVQQPWHALGSKILKAESSSMVPRRFRARLFLYSPNSSK